MQDNLYVMRSEIGKQCSVLRSGLVCSCREDLRINLRIIYETLRARDIDQMKLTMCMNRIQMYVFVTAKAFSFCCCCLF